MADDSDAPDAPVDPELVDREALDAVALEAVANSRELDEFEERLDALEDRANTLLGLEARRQQRAADLVDGSTADTDANADDATDSDDDEERPRGYW